jgi:hypothetical protein
MPFHRQQSSPFHDERRLPWSDRPALKVRRANLSLAIQLVIIPFVWANLSSVVLLA